MSKPMNKDEFLMLMQHIREEHSPAQMNDFGRCVKYVDPHIDMRDGAVFAIGFRGYGWEQTLHTQNECRDLPESLYDRCMSLLDNSKDI
jgi:hypothetical protein